MNRKFLALAAAALLAVPVFAKTDAQGLIPSDAATVGIVHLDQMRTSPLSGALFQQTDKIASDGDAAQFLLDAGLKPSTDIDTIVVATSPKTNLGTDTDVLIAADGRFNIDRLSSALTARGAVKKTVNGGTYFLLPVHKNGETDATHQGAVAFPNSNLALAGTEAAVTAALAARAAGGTNFATSSALGPDIARIDAKATAWALIDVTRAQRLVGSPHVSTGSPAGAAVNTALKNVSTVAIWATDTGDQVKLGAFGLSSDGETLQLLEDTIRGALSAMRLAVQDKQPDMVTVLRRFSVSRSSDSVTISGSIPSETFKKYAAEHHAASK
jgi:hypothetical protein